jgi:hypothetical protein
MVHHAVPEQVAELIEAVAGEARAASSHSRPRLAAVPPVPPRSLVAGQPQSWPEASCRQRPEQSPTAPCSCAAAQGSALPLWPPLPRVRGCRPAAGGRKLWSASGARQARSSAGGPPGERMADAMPAQLWLRVDAPRPARSCAAVSPRPARLWACQQGPAPSARARARLRCGKPSSQRRSRCSR